MHRACSEKFPQAQQSMKSSKYSTNQLLTSFAAKTFVQLSIKWTTIVGLSFFTPMLQSGVPARGTYVLFAIGH